MQVKKEIIIIAGLPGCGKSHLIKQRFLENSQYIVFDDFKAGAVLDCPNFCFSRYYPEIIRQLTLGKRGIVIADIDFCSNDAYLEVKKILNWWIKNFVLNYKIKSIFFKNEPVKCKKNLAKDPNYNFNERSNMIEKYTNLYFPDNMATKDDEILSVSN